MLSDTEQEQPNYSTKVSSDVNVCLMQVYYPRSSITILCITLRDALALLPANSCVELCSHD